MIDVHKLQILVEGGDDAQIVKFFVHRKLGKWLNTRFDPAPVSIVSCRDKNGVLDRLRAIRSESAWSTVAAIVDADVALETAWRQVSDCLVGEALPPDFRPGDVVSLRLIPRFSVWLMHGSKKPDMEGFLADIRQPSPEQTALWHHAVGATGQVPHRLFKDKDQHKAEFRSWLAWQKEPGASPGVALSQGAFDLNHPAAEAFADWWRRVLDVQP